MSISKISPKNSFKAHKEKHGRGRVPGMNRSNASEKIYSFRGVWRFELCYLKMLYFEDIFDII